MTILAEVATELGVPTPTVDNVEGARTMKAKIGKVSPILIRFHDRRIRDEWAPNEML